MNAPIYWLFRLRM